MNDLIAVYIDGPCIIDTDGALADIWDASIKAAHSLCCCEDGEHTDVRAVEWNDRHTAEAAQSLYPAPCHIVTKVRAETVWS